jgi:hypothetical protein
VRKISGGKSVSVNLMTGPAIPQMMEAISNNKYAPIRFWLMGRFMSIKTTHEIHSGER